MYGYNQKCFHAIKIRRVCRYQRGNQNPYIEEEQTTQWSKEKLQMTNNDLQNKTTVLLQIVRFTGNADGIFQRLIINM
jgi:hypothetical protein